MNHPTIRLETENDYRAVEELTRAIEEVETEEQRAEVEGMVSEFETERGENEQAIADLFPVGTAESGSLLTDVRQEEAARRARDAIRRAAEAMEWGLTPDAILTDVEDALDALGELTGRSAKDEIVSRIFERFCVGK